MSSKIQIQQTSSGYTWTIYVQDVALMKSNFLCSCYEAAMQEASYWETVANTPYTFS
jgi:hypothetical protein